MRTRLMISAACFLAATLASISHLAHGEDAIPPKPAAHTERQLEGWTVHVDDRLVAGDGAALGQKALRLLETRLVEIKLVVPAEKVERLQKVPFWLDQTCGSLKSPQYHPNVEWLKKHEYDEKLAKCVHIPSAEYFCATRFQREQPLGVLHELAHAYHDQVLSFEQAEIKAAWRKFAEGGRYASVLHANGKKRPHYALVNQMEFFAEMTESYFGSNDFFPFNAAELQQEEPDIHTLLTTIWGPLP